MFITTAIDYPNDKPHIGTAYEKVIADIYTRYMRLKGYNVFFQGGNDENTQKIIKKSNGNPQKFVDEIYNDFSKIWKDLNISYDLLIRTSSNSHKKQVQNIIEKLYENNYIYKKYYEGKYCEGCEEFKEICENHPEQVITRKEENYFFKVSEFKEYIKNIKIDIYPGYKINEINNIIENLEDLSISRINKGWGIEIPWDKTQVVYVWFDALLNYITGLQFQSDKFKKYFPPETMFIGKDILRFHYILFPIILEAVNKSFKINIELPKTICCHGFIIQNNKKISKSNNNIEIDELVKKYGSDAIRYFFARKCQIENDSEFSESLLKSTYSSDLVNDLGNLVSRISNLFDRSNNIIFKNIWNYSLEDYGSYIKQYKYAESLDIIWTLIRDVNKFINDQEPWKNTDKISEITSALLIIAELLKPFLPESSEKILKIFKNKIQLDNIKNGNTIEVNNRKVILFPKIN